MLNNSFSKNRVPDINDFAEELVDILYEKYDGEEDLEIVRDEVVKFNDRLLHAMIFRIGEKDAAPTIYAEEVYDRYMLGCSLSELADEVLEAVRNADRMRPEVCRESFDFGDIENRLLLKLVDTCRNRKYLGTIPHREVGNGFALVCQVCSDNSGEWRVTVSDDLISETGLSEEKMFSRAIVKAAEVDRPVLNVFPPGFCNCNLFDEVNVAPIIKNNNENGAGTFILTTESGRGGSAALYYPGIQRRIAEIVGGSYYVLPCSIHELLIVRDQPYIDTDRMLEMIHLSNVEVLPPDEVLSDRLLFFNSDLGTLETISQYTASSCRMVS